MGFGLGLDPRRLHTIGGAAGDQPGERIARLYEATFGRDRPGAVRTLEELAERLGLRKSEARSAPPSGTGGGGGEGPGRIVRLGVPVGLQAFVEQLAHATDEVLVYLDRRIGEFLPVTDETLLLAELDPDELARRPEPEQRAVARLREAEHDPDRFLVVPDPWHVDRAPLLGQFLECVEDEALRELLEPALRGGGAAVGRIRELIQSHGLEREWNAFEAAVLIRIAREWLEAHGLPYRDDLTT